MPLLRGRHGDRTPRLRTLRVLGRGRAVPGPGEVRTRLRDRRRDVEVND